MLVAAADQITLSKDEQKGLEALISSHKTGQQIALRARIVIIAGEKIGVLETARRLGVRGKTVRRWRKRWCSSTGSDVVGRLSDKPRSGKPCKFTPEQVCKIIALACESPDADSGLPVTHWSRRTLAQEAVRRKIVPEISETSAGRFLKRC
jgi:transposase